MKIPLISKRDNKKPDEAQTVPVEQPQPTPEQTETDNETFLEKQEEAQEDRQMEEFVFGEQGGISADNLAHLYGEALRKKVVKLKLDKNSARDAINFFHNTSAMANEDFATSNVTTAEITLSLMPRYRLAYYALNQGYLKTSAAFYNDLSAKLELNKSIGFALQRLWGTMTKQKVMGTSSGSDWGATNNTR